ncbi:MAG: hypothetical protein ACOYT8_01350 [Candidatus Dependentiae bacterium]
MIHKITLSVLLMLGASIYGFEITVINKTGFDIEVSRIMPPLQAKDQHGKPIKIIGKTKVLAADQSVKLYAKNHGLADLSVQGIYKGRKVGPQSLIRSASKTGFTGNQAIEVYFSDKLQKFYYKKIG